MITVTFVISIFALVLGALNLFLTLKIRGSLIKIVGPAIDDVKTHQDALVKKLKKIL